MAKITDPDLLTRATVGSGLGTTANTWVDTVNKTIALSAQGALDDTSFVEGGVSIQALYSFLKEEWKTDNELIKYPFPMVAITPEQFEFVDIWEPSGSATITLFRDGGFAITSGGSTTREYIGVITLGDVSLSQVYYSQSGGNFATTNFVLTGAVNQCVSVYENADFGNFDYRDYFTVYAREQGDLYDQANHTDIGVTTFTYQAYRFPLATGTDLKITNSDAHIATASTHTGVTIEYFATGQLRQGFTQGDGYFDIIIDGDGQAKEDIYEKVQYLLRQTDDIDSGAGIVSGKTADLLLTFVGDTLVTSTGVFVDNINPSDTNAIEFYETGATLRTYPYVAAGTLSFNDNLTGDSASIYRTFFTNNDAGDDDGSDYGTAGAILVRQNDTVEAKTDISFSATGNEIHSTSTNFSTSNITAYQLLEITGTSNQATNNPFFVTVTGVSANTLAVKETLVDEAEGSDVSIFELLAGDVNGQASVTFSYDYDGNIQRGAASTGTTAPVTVVAIGLSNAQYVKATGNIVQSNANTLSLVAALERNYSNP